MDIVRPGYFRSLLMTPAAQKRNIELGYDRFRRSRVQDVMGTVTIDAPGGQLRARLDRFAVEAIVIHVGDIVMTEAAVDRFQFFFMRKILEAVQVK